MLQLANGKGFQIIKQSITVMSLKANTMVMPKRKFKLYAKWVVKRPVAQKK